MHARLCLHLSVLANVYVCECVHAYASECGLRVQEYASCSDHCDECHCDQCHCVKQTWWLAKHLIGAALGGIHAHLQICIHLTC